MAKLPTIFLLFELIVASLLRFVSSIVSIVEHNEKRRTHIIIP